MTEYPAINPHQQVALDEGVTMPAVLEQLQRIRASPGFANAPRLSQLLSYLVENSAAGDVRSLLESAIAIEVFGRGEGFDPQSDTIVRVTVRRLRRCLADYYHQQGRGDSIRFRIPKGHYRVEIALRVPPVKRGMGAWVRRPSNRLAFGATACLLLAMIAIVEYARPPAAAQALEGGANRQALPELLLGQQLLHRRDPGDVQLAVQEFERAISKDPGNAGAWVGLGSALRLLYLREPDQYQNTRPRQYWALHQALALDPSNPEAYARLASLRLYAGDLAGARRLMGKALKFGKHNNLVLSMIAGWERASGNLQGAVALQRKANSYPPLDFASYGNLAYMLYEVGSLDEALDVFYRTERMSPLEPQAPAMIVKALILQDRLREADQKLSQVPSGAYRQQATALLDYAFGREKESLQALQDLARQTPSLDLHTKLAEAFAFRREYGRAMDEIEAAYEQILEEPSTARCEDIQTLLNSPYLANLHEHPRFLAWADRARAVIASARPSLMTLATLETAIKGQRSALADAHD